MKQTKKLPHSKWIWLPHPAHFCGADKCKFHLATWVGHVIVSTVGDYFPFQGNAGLGKKTEIGCGRFYETMVFKVDPNPNTGTYCGCPYLQRDGRELDFEGYNDPEKARLGHMKMCQKWAGCKP